MIPLYPYMFKAFYDWLLDSDANPRIMVDASQKGVEVPKEYVTRNKILISIHPKYISELNIGPFTISFYTQFKGKREFVVVPYYAMNELICWDSGLTIPLSMWLTSIEMASHPNFELSDLTSYGDEGPMPSDGKSIEVMDHLSDAEKKVQFEICDTVEPTTNKSQSKAQRLQLEKKLEKKSKPNFTLV